MTTTASVETETETIAHRIAAEVENVVPSSMPW